MSDRLNNDEIREKLLKFDVDCGPVTDTTREIHLKKLEALARSEPRADRPEISDDQLRSQLIAMGESVGPITPISRPTYLKRLRRLKRRIRAREEAAKSEVSRVIPGCDSDDCEPMDIDHD